ncbi:MAG: hypothetical protein ACI9OJ_002371 [Myxococcota bacterium]
MVDLGSNGHLITQFVPFDLVVWLAEHADESARVDVSPPLCSTLREAMSLIGSNGCDATMRQTVTTSGSISSQRFDQLELRFHFPSGAKVAQDQFSYGQQRIVAYYYYPAASPSIVVADELVNGMHHDWIAACVGSLEGRQAFLSSQNPLLLDQLPFENPDQISRSLVICTANERGDFVWRNPNEAEAKRIAAALAVGIQQVSEVLEAQGLW